MTLGLVRRREVWWPTWRGWLLMLLLGAGTIATVVLSAYRFMSPIAPARGPDGRGARTLVVEGWVDPPTLTRVVQVVRAGRYDRVLTTGGPIDGWMDIGHWGTYAERAASTLRADGRIGAPIVAVPAPDSEKERTYQSALAVREWGERHGVALPALDVFTADVHARRSRLVYRLAFGRTAEIGILADRADDPAGERWWGSSASAKRLMGEVISWVWTACCFWPEAVGPEAPVDPGLVDDARLR